MTDAQMFFAVWFGAILTLAFIVALHPLLHWCGRLADEWLADRAERRRIEARRDPRPILLDLAARDRERRQRMRRRP